MEKIDKNPSGKQSIYWTRVTSGAEPIKLPMSVTIDSNVSPKIPPCFHLTGKGTKHKKTGKIILEKRTDGKLYANNVEVIRYYSPKQKVGEYIQGHDLRKELNDRRILNASILDALYMNPHLIPDDWKIGYSYFWGTIFRGVYGILYVECLCWSGFKWSWNYRQLNESWSGVNSAAMLAD